MKLTAKLRIDGMKVTSVRFDPNGCAVYMTVFADIAGKHFEFTKYARTSQLEVYEIDEDGLATFLGYAPIDSALKLEAIAFTAAKAVASDPRDGTRHVIPARAS